MPSPSEIIITLTAKATQFESGLRQAQARRFRDVLTDSHVDPISVGAILEALKPQSHAF